MFDYGTNVTYKKIMKYDRALGTNGLWCFEFLSTNLPTVSAVTSSPIESVSHIGSETSELFVANSEWRMP